MRRILSLTLCALLSAIPLSGDGGNVDELMLPLSVYRDKVKAVWQGKGKAYDGRNNAWLSAA